MKNKLKVHRRAAEASDSRKMRQTENAINTLYSTSEG